MSNHYIEAATAWFNQTPANEILKWALAHDVKFNEWPINNRRVRFIEAHATFLRTGKTTQLTFE